MASIGDHNRCTHEGCRKMRVAPRKLCVAHGGGYRCQMEGCDKPGAGCGVLCREHGGGGVCDIPGCNDNVTPGLRVCWEHGGGFRFTGRCETKGCLHMQVPPGDRCIPHGAGPRCVIEGCGVSTLTPIRKSAERDHPRECTADDCEEPSMVEYPFCTLHCIPVKRRRLGNPDFQKEKRRRHRAD